MNNQKIICPNCGADHLWLCTKVFLPFSVTETGTPYLLDISRYTREDIIENIEEDGSEEYRCYECGAVFKAIQSDDDFTFSVGEEIS